MRKKDSNQISTLFMAGIGSMLVGFGCIFFGLIGSLAIGNTGVALVGLGILLGLGGGGLTLGSILYGLRQEKGDQKETRVVVIQDAQITARFAINRLGETIFDADYLDFDDPKTKLYIKITAPTVNQLELRTNPAVWGSCGEGMRGHAHVQGDWLGQFERVAVTPPTGNPYLRE